MGKGVVEDRGLNLGRNAVRVRSLRAAKARWSALFVPHLCEIHPSCLCSWLISFAAQYVFRGAAQNRGRSTASPAPRRQGHREITQMSRANIEPEAVADVFERAPEHDVLVVLSVGNEGHVLCYPFAISA